MTDVPPLTPDEIRFLRSLLKGFTADEWRVLKAMARAVVGAGAVGGGTTAEGPRVATAAELADRYGNPKVRKNPKRWAGASYVGATYSECSTDFLLVMAEYLEWGANKDKMKGADARKHEKSGKFYWEFDLRDAALARGWAVRNKGKPMPPPAPPEDDPVSDEPSSDDFDQSATGDSDEEWTPS